MKWPRIIATLVLVFWAAAASAQITPQTPSTLASACSGSFPTTITGNLPPGTASGHRLVAFISEYPVSGTPSLTPPAGWSSVLSATDGETFASLSVFTIAASNSSPPHAWTESGAGMAPGGVCYMVRIADYTGVNSIGPSASSVTGGSPAMSLDSAQVTPGVANTYLLVGLASLSASTLSVTGSPSLTQRWLDLTDPTTGSDDFMGDLAVAGLGLTTSYHFAFGVGNAAASIVLLLNPGPTSTPTPQPTQSPTPTQTPTPGPTPTVCNGPTSTPQFTPTPQPTCAGPQYTLHTAGNFASLIYGPVGADGNTTLSAFLPEPYTPTDVLVAVLETKTSSAFPETIQPPNAWSENLSQPQCASVPAIGCVGGNTNCRDSLCLDIYYTYGDSSFGTTWTFSGSGSPFNAKVGAILQVFAFSGMNRPPNFHEINDAEAFHSQLQMVGSGAINCSRNVLTAGAWFTANCAGPLGLQAINASMVAPLAPRTNVFVDDAGGLMVYTVPGSFQPPDELAGFNGVCCGPNAEYLAAAKFYYADPAPPTAIPTPTTSFTPGPTPPPITPTPAVTAVCIHCQPGTPVWRPPCTPGPAGPCGEVGPEWHPGGQLTFVTFTPTPGPTSSFTSTPTPTFFPPPPKPTPSQSPTQTRTPRPSRTITPTPTPLITPSTPTQTPTPTPHPT